MNVSKHSTITICTKWVEALQDFHDEFVSKVRAPGKVLDNVKEIFIEKWKGLNKCRKELTTYVQQHGKNASLNGVNINQLLQRNFEFLDVVRQFQRELAVSKLKEGKITIDEYIDTLPSSMMFGKRPLNVNLNDNVANEQNKLFTKRPNISSGGKNKNLRSNQKEMPTKTKSEKPAYKKTARKYTDSKGKKCTIYKKGEKEYIKKLSKSTGKFVYRSIKA